MSIKKDSNYYTLWFYHLLQITFEKQSILRPLDKEVILKDIVTYFVSLKKKHKFFYPFYNPRHCI